MLKVYIDGKHFQDQMRQCKIKEGQVFHLKLVKIAHDRLGQWDIYFESLPEKCPRCSGTDIDYETEADMLLCCDCGLIFNPDGTFISESDRDLDCEGGR